PRTTPCLTAFPTRRSSDLDVRAVTAELSIEYLRPIRVDEEIVVEAFQSQRDGRQLFHQGEIRNSEGQLLARGKGRFVVVDPARLDRKSTRLNSSHGSISYD